MDFDVPLKIMIHQNHFEIDLTSSGLKYNIEILFHQDLNMVDHCIKVFKELYKFIVSS